MLGCTRGGNRNTFYWICSVRRKRLGMSERWPWKDDPWVVSRHGLWNIYWNWHGRKRRLPSLKTSVSRRRRGSLTARHIAWFLGWKAVACFSFLKTATWKKTLTSPAGLGPRCLKNKCFGDRRMVCRFDMFIDVMVHASLYNFWKTCVRCSSVFAKVASEDTVGEEVLFQSLFWLAWF